MSRRSLPPTYSNLISPSPSTSTSTMSDDDDAAAQPPPPPPPPATTGARTLSVTIREDCWAEAATHTLIDAWGSHYVQLNRGNLRQKQWQEVADAVNALHAHTKKLHRTDIQCKNRIDTLKKKYKVEKAKVNDTNGHYVSPWPFFASIHSLVGDKSNSLGAASQSPPPSARKTVALPAPVRNEFLALPPPPSAVPVGPRSKRPAHGVIHSEKGGFRRNFMEEVEEVEEENGGVKMRKRRRMAVGYTQLAEAIGRFGEIYQRVEEAKQRQLVELEKQRMQFANDLEIQRMKLFMESQIQLEKLKPPKRTSQSGE